MIAYKIILSLSSRINLITSSDFLTLEECQRMISKCDSILSILEKRKTKLKDDVEFEQVEKVASACLYIKFLIMLREGELLEKNVA